MITKIGRVINSHLDNVDTASRKAAFKRTKIKTFQQLEAEAKERREQYERERKEEYARIRNATTASE